MDALLNGWPYLTLLLAPLVAVAAGRRATGDRLRDPMVLLGLLLPLYMLHQFEEHGVDLLGRRYAFQADFCTTLGFPDVARCPGDRWFILAVNVGGVWLAGGLAFALARRPALAAAFLGLPFVNALAHIGAAIFHRQYNPGLASAMVLLLPYSVWTARLLVVRQILPLSALPLAVLAGVLIHGVLIGAMQLEIHWLLPPMVAVLLQVANGAVPLGPGLLMERLVVRRR